MLVRGDDAVRPVHFVNDIEPILSRYGCNSGGCHGKATGQNGFRLSLFGFDARFDHDALVHDLGGRRVLRAAPEQSLVLRKASYSDGTVRDVTRRSQFQSNEAGVAAVEPDGLIRTLDQAGEAAVMARYQGQVAVFRATVPLDAPGAATAEFPAANFVDTRMAAKLRSLGLVPSGLCTDGEFLRRATLDLCGRLPAAEDVRAFLADPAADKRARLIDRLLDDKDYPAYFALRWGSILRNSPQAGSEQAAYAFHEWLRDMIARNRPYDEFARGIVAASGEWPEATAVNWFWQMHDDQLHQPVADTAHTDPRNFPHRCIDALAGRARCEAPSRPRAHHARP